MSAPPRCVSSLRLFRVERELLPRIDAGWVIGGRETAAGIETADLGYNNVATVIGLNGDSLA